MTASARIEMRIKPSFKEEAERAAALLGMKSLTEFIAQAMHEKAQEVIKKHERLSLNNDDFDRFFNACEDNAAPSKKLKSLFAKADAQGFE